MASTERATTTVAGRYDVGVLIGRGGMSEVYRAHDRILDRPVALKVLRADVAESPRARERLLHEARAAARLSHARIVQVFDTGVDGGHPFIVMELLSGWSLRDRIAEGRLDREEAVGAALQVLEGLEVAHAAGLVHRDVKPENVLLDTHGGWKVTDFGIAKWMNATGSLTQTGELLGSPSYLAPERLAGLEGSPRGDLYAVGVLLFEAMAGRPPFAGDSPLVVAVDIREGGHLRIGDLCPSVDKRLAAAIERAMALDPMDRYASAAEMGQALESANIEEPQSVWPLPDPVEPDAMAAADATGPVEAPGEVTQPLETITASTRLLPVQEPRESWFRQLQAGRHISGRRVVAAIGAVIVCSALAIAIVLLRSRPEGHPATPARSGPVAVARTGAERLQDALDRLDKAVRP